MPTIKENYNMWNNIWEATGDEWSITWGGVDKQWNGAILPRIQRYVPAGTILEVAPGHGRWTQFLAPLCKKLMVVDLSETCIDTCKKRFKKYEHIDYFVTDGMSLKMIPDNSVDFVFSFDSLVHAEEDVIRAYLTQLKDKLKLGGYGFIHHSNAGIYTFPEPDPNWRATSMTAKIFRDYAVEAGLACIEQEIINWSADKLLDCFSVITNNDRFRNIPCKLSENPNFMREAKEIKDGYRRHDDTKNV